MNMSNALASIGHATSVTGWGVEHDCIDFELLRQFQIEQERKYNLTWQHGFFE